MLKNMLKLKKKWGKIKMMEKELIELKSISKLDIEQLLKNDSK